MQPRGNKMLKIDNIKKAYHRGDMEIEILHGISLEIPKGEFVSIMGPSGSGKSTLLSIIGCLNKPTSGVIEIDGINVGKLKEKEIAELRNRKLGFVFQRFHLLPDRTAVENVELPMQYNPAISSKESVRRAKAMLEHVELGHRLNHTPNSMSGGECQRIAIARALVNEPAIVLADEPTGSLDSKTGIEIIRLLRKLQDEKKITVVMVTHDPKIAKMTDRIICVKDGLLSEELYGY